MNMDTLVIVLCILAAVVFIGNKAYRALKGSGTCSCGCNCAKSSVAASRPASGSTPCCRNAHHQE